MRADSAGGLPSAAEATSRLSDFFASPPEVLLGAAVGALAFWVGGSAAGALRRRGWRDGDTRKIFHVIIFTTAGLLRIQADIGVVAAYGAVVFLGVLLAVRRGEGDLVFEALARQSDRPRRGLHVVLPLVATALGGVTAHIVAGPLAAPVLLVGGWGDAVGEPVGIRWGRRRFRVPTLGGVRATRSLEGTAAVGLASCVAAYVGLVGCGYPPPEAFRMALALGGAATVVESVSPHGLDNFTILAVCAGLVRYLAG